MLINGFIIILGYIIAYSVLLWYATCTIHHAVPKIFSIFYFIICLIPIVNYFICFIWIAIYIAQYSTDIELKDNWFNRTFLAYNAK